MKKTINVIGYDCDVTIQHFNPSNQICLVLTSANTEHNKGTDTFPGEPIGKPSVYLEGVEIGEKQTFIKDYSESKGMLAKLVEAGIVKETGYVVNIGFTKTDNVHLVDVLI